MKVLIVGAGIAGPTLAYWLARDGHDVTLLERAPEPRRGGYVVDFWGTGYTVAERMGLVPRLLAEGYHFRTMREVSDHGRKITQLDAERLIAGADGRYVTIARSDLAAAILDAVRDVVEAGGAGSIEMLFGDTVERLDDDGDRVRVELTSGGSRAFDLVIGADGLHSRVRALAFGPEAGYERDLGIAVAAFDIRGYRPRDELIAITRTQVGAQTLRIALRDDVTMFCFMFRHEGAVPIDDVTAQQELLRRRLGHLGWEVPRILELMPTARTFYLDKASQIRMPSWSRGRVALIGDAAASPSLLAGQGSALAMVEAYVLARALRDAHGDHAAAFAAYEQRLAPVVRTKQDAAIGLGTAFAPRTRAQLIVRDALVGLMGIPFVANLVTGRSLRDPIELPPPSD
ncbi:FAD-binding domain [Pseudolysinimonas kribbensis]|uniref:Oxidoreductase n=1 Tax=Pseudolysinimonas kribbensis TaxID=433641 RepID=A0ABQ6K4S3_9MICO|nr:FAD-binding domain [Pseudolysinimonas kribbensis]GMA95354.1 oxidoreductase [Pseudolysinimonas kribbensis]